MRLHYTAAFAALLPLAATVIPQLPGQPASTEALRPGFVPLTNFRAHSAFVKYNRALIEQVDLSQWTQDLIGYEQSLWMRIGAAIAPCGVGAWCMKATPNQPAFLEWYALAQQKSDRAAAALEALLEPGAARSPAVFVFPRTAVEGREPSFAAHELQPVLRELLLQAGARAPEQIALSVPLPDYEYDFTRKALVFAAVQRSRYERREPGELLTALTRSMYEGPSISGPAAERTAYLAGRLPTEPENDSPAFRLQSFLRGSGSTLPNVSVIATDRQLRVEALPMDASKAEHLVKARQPLIAHVYLTLDGAQTVDPTPPGRRPREGVRPFGVLLARIEGIDVTAGGGTVVATVRAADLPRTEPAAAAPFGASPVTQPRPSRPVSSQRDPVAAGTDEIKTRIRAMEAELTSLRQKLSMLCQQSVSQLHPDQKSGTYRTAYAACVR
jgi:hypothetical protein